MRTRVVCSTVGSWASGRASILTHGLRAMTCITTSTSSEAWSHGRGRGGENGGSVVETAAAARMCNGVMQRMNGAGMGAAAVGCAVHGQDRVSYTHRCGSRPYTTASSMSPLVRSTTMMTRTTKLSPLHVVQQHQQQRRWVLSVPVTNNNVEAASRKLKRLSLAEGDKREEKKRRAFIKPSVRAKMVRDASPPPHPPPHTATQRRMARDTTDHIVVSACACMCVTVIDGG